MKLDIPFSALFPTLNLAALPEPAIQRFALVILDVDALLVAHQGILAEGGGEGVERTERWFRDAKERMRQYKWPKMSRGERGVLTLFAKLYEGVEVVFQVTDLQRARLNPHGMRMKARDLDLEDRAFQMWGPAAPSVLRVADRSWKGREAGEVHPLASALQNEICHLGRVELATESEHERLLTTLFSGFLAHAAGAFCGEGRSPGP
jgi:hypothetical protein